MRHLTDVRKKDKTFPQPKMLGERPCWAPSAIRRWIDDGAPCRSCTAGGAPASHALTAPQPASSKARKGKGAPRVH